MSGTEIAALRAEIATLKTELLRLRTIVVGEEGDNGLKSEVVRLRESLESGRRFLPLLALIAGLFASACAVLGFFASHIFKSGAPP